MLKEWAKFHQHMPSQDDFGMDAVRYYFRASHWKAAYDGNKGTIGKLARKPHLLNTSEQQITTRRHDHK
jgi:hypothetical protein